MSDVSKPAEPTEGGLRLDKIVRTFKQAGRRLEVLREVDLVVSPGEMVALVGPSGAGKSTLLHVAGLLERPDSGEIYIEGRAAGRLSDRERTAIRRSTLGFVYQYHHLLPEFSALENVVLPQMIAGLSKRAAKKRAGELLATVGLAERADHRPARLSGGEQQRVAIARGLGERAGHPHGRRAHRQPRSRNRRQRFRPSGQAGPWRRPGRPDRHP